MFDSADSQKSDDGHEKQSQHSQHAEGTGGSTVGKAIEATVAYGNTQSSAESSHPQPESLDHKSSQADKSSAVEKSDMRPQADEDEATQLFEELERGDHSDTEVKPKDPEATQAYSDGEHSSDSELPHVFKPPVVTQPVKPELSADRATQLCDEGDAPLNIDAKANEQTDEGATQLFEGEEVVDGGATQLAGEDGATQLGGDEGATQLFEAEEIVGGRATQLAADEGATQLAGDDGATQLAGDEGATQLFEDISEPPENVAKVAEEAATQLAYEDGATQLAGADEGATQLAGDEPTQLFEVGGADVGATQLANDDTGEEATQLAQDGPEATQLAGDDGATQLFEAGEHDDGEPTQLAAGSPTQPFEDAAPAHIEPTQAFEDSGTTGGEPTQALQDSRLVEGEPTQAWDDDSVAMPPPRAVSKTVSKANTKPNVREVNLPPSIRTPSQPTPQTTTYEATLALDEEADAAEKPTAYEATLELGNEPAGNVDYEPTLAFEDESHEKDTSNSTEQPQEAAKLAQVYEPTLALETDESTQPTEEPEVSDTKNSSSQSTLLATPTKSGELNLPPSLRSSPSSSLNKSGSSQSSSPKLSTSRSFSPKTSPNQSISSSKEIPVSSFGTSNNNNASMERTDSTDADTGLRGGRPKRGPAKTSVLSKKPTPRKAVELNLPPSMRRNAEKEMPQENPKVHEATQAYVDDGDDAESATKEDNYEPTLEFGADDSKPANEATQAYLDEDIGGTQPVAYLLNL